MPVAHALSMRDGLGVFRSLPVLSRVTADADRPKVLGHFLAALCVPDNVIRAPVDRFGRDQINRATAHVTGEAFPAKQVEPCVSVYADAASLGAVAVHNGTSANVSAFFAFLSLTGGMICDTFSPVSASITSATSSNSAHADRCGSVSKSIDLLSIT